MTKYIPDELYNTIQSPPQSWTDKTLDGMFGEIAYKLPKIADVIAKKEIWHCICDFCGRVGALIDRKDNSFVTSGNPPTTSYGTTIQCTSAYGDLLRVVGCKKNGQNNQKFQWAGENVLDCSEGEGVLCVAEFSVLPKYDDSRIVSGVWNPSVPDWFFNKYGECVMHGSLMRIYAMTHEPWANVDLARLHAIAYNNDMVRHSFGLITSGMRKTVVVDIEDMLIASSVGAKANGNG